MKLIKKSLRMHREIMKAQAGFSLLEILIALTLLGIVGTFVTINVLEKLEEGRREAANIQMSNFATALKEFKRKCGFYPTSEQGLDSLINKPGGKECKNYPPNGFLAEEAGEIPGDPWDEQYFYESDGNKFRIWSYGPDREEGGENLNADLHYPKKSNK